jgi:hypothetical protein
MVGVLTTPLPHDFWMWLIIRRSQTHSRVASQILATLRQRHNETPMEFIRRFRETKGMCYSSNLPDDQLADMAVAGMLSAIREKLFGMEFDNLGQLSQRLSLMSNQAYGVKTPDLPNTMT